HDILCKWLKPAEEPSGQRSVSDLPALDVKVFEELCSSLRWKRAPLLNICANFTASAEKILEQLESRTGIDRRLLRRAIHTVLGSAGMVGARQVEFIARALQEDLKANRNVDFDAVFALLKNCIRSFEREFHDRLDELGQRDSMAPAQRWSYS
ncbi:MAG TPA: Hpt domain-containing protein, partial [Steroidobacteraceae bacterium]